MSSQKDMGGSGVSITTTPPPGDGSCNRCFQELMSLRQELHLQQQDYHKLLAAHEAVVNNVTAIGGNDKQHDMAIQSMVSRLERVELSISTIKTDYVGLSKSTHDSHSNLNELVRDLISKYTDIKEHNKAVAAKQDQFNANYHKFEMDYVTRNAELRGFENIVKQHLDKTDGISSTGLTEFRKEIDKKIEANSKSIEVLKLKSAEELGAQKKMTYLTALISAVCVLVTTFLIVYDRLSPPNP